MNPPLLIPYDDLPKGQFRDMIWKHDGWGNEHYIICYRSRLRWRVRYR